MITLIMVVMIVLGGAFMGLPKVLKKVNVKMNNEARYICETVGLFFTLIGIVGLFSSLANQNSGQEQVAMLIKSKCFII